MTTGYNKTTIGKQTITVKYDVPYTLSSTTLTERITQTFQVEVTNPAKTIAITKPSTTTYNWGSNLNYTGGKIVVTYANNTTDELGLEDATIKEGTAAVNMSPAASEFGTATTLNKTLTISYTEDDVTESIPYPITIINDVKSISMKTNPKTTYNVNDTIDLSGGEIYVTRAASTTPEAINMNDTRVEVTGFNSSQEKTGQVLTVTFTENGISKTTTYNINIVDSVKSISIKTTPKTNYKYGDNLDVSNGQIEVVKGSATTTINMTNDMVTGYDKEVLEDQELTVTYGGKTAKYHIYVKDYVKEITLSQSTITGKYDDTLAKLLQDNPITYTVKYAKTGDRDPEPLTESMIASYNPQTINTQNLTVTYTDNDNNSFTKGTPFTKPIAITLADEVDTITITPPTKTKYKHGEALDLAGGTITVTTKSGGSKNVTMTTNMITEGGATVNMSPTAENFGSNTTLTKNLTISYTEGGKPGTVAYPITIINDVQSIIMNQNPKTDYNVKDPIDLSGGSILVTRAVGTPVPVDLTDNRVEVTGFNSSQEQTNQTLTVTFTENEISKTTTYKVNITDSVKSIEIETEPKKKYKYNEELEVTGGQINVTKGSGTTTIPITKEMVTGYKKQDLGDQELTVTYGGKTDKYTVNVKDYVEEITLSQATITGKYNDTLAKLIEDNTITYTVVYAKARGKEPEPLTESMVAGYNSQTIDTQNLTVTYTDNDNDSFTKGRTFTKPIAITLADEVDTITITPPTKTKYKHGEALDLLGGSITVTTKSGKSKNVTMTRDMIKENGATVDMRPTAEDFGTNTTLTKNLTISYTEGGKSGTIAYPITIINDVQSIIMNQNPKTDYNVKDPIDLSGGSILVTRSVGTPVPVDLTDNRVEVTGFDSNQEQTNQTLTVTFTENEIPKTTTYNINITDSVKSIKIEAEPKKKYKYNDELDVTGGTIKVTKGSGTTTIPITKEMVTGYDKEVLEDQELTVTYGGKTDKYTVNVKDYVEKITLSQATITGRYNDTLTKLIDDNTITYTVVYAKAKGKEPEPLTESMVSTFSSTDTNPQNLTVTYLDNDDNSFTKGENKTATLTVTLVDEVTEIVMKDTPTKTDYGYGETLEPEGGSITVTRLSGKTEDKTLEEEGITITETDGTPLDLSNVTFNEQHKAQKTVQVNYGGKKATFLIDVTNKITKIEMQDTPKQDYYIGDSQDLTTDGTTYGTILATRQNGDTETIPLNNPNVSVTGFDSTEENTNLPITVSYTENNVTKSTTYDVSIIDNVGSAQIGATPKTNYRYNEPLDVSTGTIKVTRGSNEEFIPMRPNMVTEADGTPFNPQKLGTRNLTVTYGGQTMYYEVTVSDYVQGIELTPPTKQIYEYGQSLNLEGGTVKKVMASGAPTTAVALDDSSVTLSSFNPTQVGTQTIDVTYEGFTEQFGVEVQDNIQTIRLQGAVKGKYKYGEPLDVTGGSVVAERSSGATDEPVPLTLSMVTGYKPNEIGDQTLTITYGGKTTSYTVKVEDYVKDITINRPSKDVYKIGETINLDGGTVQKVMASGAATTPVAMTDTSVTITGFDSTTEGPKTISVTYEGHTKTFGINVEDRLSEMVIHTLPTKRDYRYGEALNLDGGSIELKKESGTGSQIINMTSNMVTGYNPKTIGTQTLTVTYEGFTKEFTVNVEDYVSNLKVEKPTKVEYEYGESLNLSGGKIAIVMASGKIQETVDMSASMITGYNAKQAGNQTIKVEYKGLQGNFTVNVIDKVKGISMKTIPSKTTYQYGENINLNNGTIDVVKSSGIVTIPITHDMISGYNPNASGTQMVTVNYGGYTTTFAVQVKEQQKTQTPSTPKAEKPVIITRNVYIPTPTEEEPVEEEPVEEKPITTPVIVEEPKKPEQKPTKTLGVKEEEPENNTIDTKIIAGGIAGLGILGLLALILLKRNVKILVEEEGVFALTGLDKLSKGKLELNINKHLDGDTYENRVKVQLSKSISKKLDGKEIQIRHRDKVQKYKIEYKKGAIEIDLK